MDPGSPALSRPPRAVEKKGDPGHGERPIARGGEARADARDHSPAGATYLAHVDPAIKANLTLDQVQDVLVAIAPVVGTARIMAAAGHITKALGFAVAVAETEAEAMAEADAQHRAKS